MLAPGREAQSRQLCRLPSPTTKQATLGEARDPGPVAGLMPAARGCMQLIYAAELSGDQPLPAMVEKDSELGLQKAGRGRSRTSGRRPSGASLSSPSRCSHI